MKVKDLMLKLAECGRPDADVLIQRNGKDGYFTLYSSEATMPDGHIGANGFVLVAGPLPEITARVGE